MSEKGLFACVFGAGCPAILHRNIIAWLRVQGSSIPNRFVPV
jgi:hypothetical protein